MSNNIIFHSGEFWFNEAGFQEKIDHPCEQMEGHDCPMCAGYNVALQVALADSVKFADQEAIRIAICELQPNKGPNYYQFKPVEGEIFFVEGITVKEWQEPLVSQFDIQAGKVPMGTAISELRKVAVLSNSPVKSETPKSEGAERLESLRKQFPGKWSIGKFAGEEGLMKDGCFVMLTNEELVYMLNELDRLQPKAEPTVERE